MVVGLPEPEDFAGERIVTMRMVHVDAPPDTNDADYTEQVK